MKKTNHPYRLLLLLLFPDVRLDGLPDGELAGALADLRQVGAREAAGHLGQVGHVHVLRHRRLPQVGLQNVHSGSVVRQRDVDQLVQTARSVQ